MRVPMPFANQPGTGLQRDGGCPTRPAPLVRALGERAQPSPDAKAQAAESAFLNHVRYATDQKVAAQPGRRRRSIQPSPFDPQIGGRQCFERDDPGFSIGPLALATGCNPLAAGGLARFLASLLGLRSRNHAPASAMR